MRNIFLYWVGKDYKLICLLRQLIYLHSTNGKGYHVHFITKKNLYKYIHFIPEFFNRLHPAHQADFVRVNVICDYGGIWLDSDIVVMNSLDNLFSIIENHNGFFIKESKGLFNCIFGSKPRTKLMIAWKNEIVNILNYKKEHIDWTEIGNTVLNRLFTNHPKLYDRYKIWDGSNNIYPVIWNQCVREYINKPYNNYKNIIRKSQPLIVLTNKVYKKLEKKSLDEILRGNLPLNYFINRSLQNVIYDFYENKRNHSIEIVKYYIDNFSSDFITSS